MMGIADGLSRMPTRYTTVPKAIDSERMALPAIRERNSVSDPYKAYRKSKSYGDIVDFLQHGVLTLKERGLGTSQIKNIHRKAHNYQLATRGLLK